MKLRTIIKVVLCVFTLLFTFLLGANYGWQECEKYTKMSGVYVYNTQQKIDGFTKMIEKTFEHLPPDKKEYALDLYTRMLRPLVYTDRIAVFVDTINGDYLINEVREGHIDFDLTILELSFLDPWAKRSRSRITFSSRIEEGWGAFRFGCVLHYSEDDVYEKGGLFIYEKDGRHARSYFDKNGTGIFDEMRVQKNDVESLYHLNGLSWEKVSEREFHHPAFQGYKNVRSSIDEPFGFRAVDENEDIETE